MMKFNNAEELATYFTNENTDERTWGMFKRFEYTEENIKAYKAFRNYVANQKDTKAFVDFQKAKEEKLIALTKYIEEKRNFDFPVVIVTEKFAEGNCATFNTTFVPYFEYIKTEIQRHKKEIEKLEKMLDKQKQVCYNKYRKKRKRGKRKWKNTLLTILLLARSLLAQLATTSTVACGLSTATTASGDTLLANGCSDTEASMPLWRRSTAQVAKGLGDNPEPFFVAPCRPARSEFTSSSIPPQKIFEKNFKKPLDKYPEMCYTLITKEREVNKNDNY